MEVVGRCCLVDVGRGRAGGRKERGADTRQCGEKSVIGVKQWDDFAHDNPYGRPSSFAGATSQRAIPSATADLTKDPTLPYPLARNATRGSWPYY